MGNVKQTTDVAIPSDPAELRKLLQRAQKGDASTLPAVRQFLRNPSAIGVLGGNLAFQAEQSLVHAAAGDNLAFREALTRKLELMREELAGPNPSPVEKLLIERVVACWLQVQYADAMFGQAKEISLTMGDYLQRRMDRAHRRYLSAIRTLAVVRKLAIPALQVNIARKQINVAGGTPAEIASGSATA